MTMDQTHKIRLLLVDDHEVVRTGLRMLLENKEDLIICGEASTASEALTLIPETIPDVVIMDITLPDMTGIEVTRIIKEKYPDIHVVALTIHEDEQYFFEMLKAGASGYVPKRAAPEDLITAIQSAFTGDIYLYPTLAKALVSDFIQRTHFEPEQISQGELTPREAEILPLIAEGLSNEEIASALSISKHTVARHRENIMSKLNLHTRSELVKYAIRKGIIKP
jgi:two-component system response regulator NreC